MNYELAKRLKDAGFPQEKFSGGYLCAHGGHAPTPDTCWDKVYCPPLEELIEACGTICPKVFDFYRSLPNWLATGIPEDGLCDCEEMPSGRGDTPIEAVANLWIELNKK